MEFNSFIQKFEENPHGYSQKLDLLEGQAGSLMKVMFSLLDDGVAGMLEVSVFRTLDIICWFTKATLNRSYARSGWADMKTFFTHNFGTVNTLQCLESSPRWSENDIDSFKKCWKTYPSDRLDFLEVSVSSFCHFKVSRFDAHCRRHDRYLERRMFAKKLLESSHMLLKKSYRLTREKARSAAW